MANPLLNVPGYTSYLYGYEIPITPNLKALCDQIMYANFMQNNVAYYKPNFARFVERVLNIPPIQMHYLHKNDFPTGYPSDPRVDQLSYYYNRQLIFQMCNIPKKNETVQRPITYPTVPIQRNHNDQMEVQMDIMFFATDFTNVKVVGKYVIILEPYTRYAWAYKINIPISERGGLTVNAVNQAIREALNRGARDHSASYQFYQYLRTHTRTVRVDQGSEFKKSFPENMAEFFPNSRIRKGYAKNNTFKRPNTTGPVEASVRMLRRVIRDQSIGARQHNRLLQDSDLQMVLEKYNNLKQLKTMGNQSPQQMASALQNSINDVDERRKIEEQDTRNDVEFKRRLIQRNIFEHAEIQKYPNVGDIAFRFYINHGEFPKETDIRVSLNLFKIIRQRPENVDLEEIPPQWRRDGAKQIKLNIRWEELVVVKSPVEDGPNATYGNFIRANFAIRRLPTGFKETAEHNENDKIIVYAPPPLHQNHLQANDVRLPQHQWYNLSA